MAKVEKEKKKLKQKIVEKKASKKVNKKEEETPAFETRQDLKKMLLYTIIVPKGQAENICRILKANKSSAQFIQVGDGTANSRVRDILGIDDTKKDVVYSLIREDAVPDLKRELDAYFAASKRNRGIAYTINLQSFVGVKLYKFFTQTVRG